MYVSDWVVSCVRDDELPGLIQELDALEQPDLLHQVLRQAHLQPYTPYSIPVSVLKKQTQ